MQYKGFDTFIKDVRRFQQNNTLNITANKDCIFNNFQSIVDFLNDIASQNPKKVREKLEQGKFEQGLQHMKNFVKSYSCLKSLFTWAKGRINLIYQNQIMEFTPLLQSYNSAALPQEKLCNNAPQTNLANAI